jgi:hypothetical protein
MGTSLVSEEFDGFLFLFISQELARYRSILWVYEHSSLKNKVPLNRFKSIQWRFSWKLLKLLWLNLLNLWRHFPK